MKIIFEQGDIVYNRNNFTYGIVINETADGKVAILECSVDNLFTNSPPKCALKYYGHIDFEKTLRDIIISYVEQDHPTEKGGAKNG
jgi:hypothetical protein